MASAKYTAYPDITMKNTLSLKRIFVFCLALASFGPAMQSTPARAADSEQAIMPAPVRPVRPAEVKPRLEQRISVNSIGDAQVEMIWTLELDEYRAVTSLLSTREKVTGPDNKVTVKLHPPTAESILAFLDLRNLKVEVHDLSCACDAAARTIRARFTMPGWAKLDRRGRWQAELLDNYRWQGPFYPFIGTAPVSGMVSYRLKNFQPGTFDFSDDDVYAAPYESPVATLEGTSMNRVANRIVVTLPYRAADALVQNNRLSFSADAPVATSNTSFALPEFRLQAKPALMASLHKIYGNPRYPTYWAARTSFRNHSQEVLTGYRLRHKVCVPGLATEWSEWREVCATVYPGQTVAEPIYPLLPPTLCQNESQTAGTLMSEYEYTRPGGAKVQSDAESKVDLLGINDALWTNLDLGQVPSPIFYHQFQDAAMVIGAFASASDPVMRDLAGDFARAIGGQDPQSSDAITLKLLETVHEMLRNTVGYKGAWAADYDGQFIQRMNHGRNVLRTRSGNCIDLAMFYASVGEMFGLESYVIVIPGHAFPAWRLPQSRKLICFEATCCGGGTLATSSSFDRALQTGADEFQKAAKEDLLIMVNIKNLRNLGASTPELPSAGTNPLRDWGIKIPALRPAANILKVEVKKHQVEGGDEGVALEVEYEVRNVGTQEVVLAAQFLDADGKPLTTENETFRDGTGGLCVKRSIQVNPENGHGTMTLILPKKELRLSPFKPQLKWNITVRSARDTFSVEQDPSRGEAPVPQ